MSAASGGNSEPKHGQRSQSARGFCPPKHDAGTATRHYRAFWQRSCRAAAAGAVLKPQGGNCEVLPVFTPDCVSFCEVSSHAANSKGRRLRFLGSHRRIVMLFYLILFAPDSFRNLFNQLELVPLLQPGQLVARSRRSQNHTAGSGRGGPLFCFVDAGNHGVLMQKTA